MAYVPTEWKKGDIVTAAKLNKLEEGVANAGGGGVLVANIDTTTMTIDKTWQEIHDAGFAIIHAPDQQNNKITHCWQVEAIYTSSVPGGTQYAIDVIVWNWTGSAYSLDSLSLSCADPDEYPHL